MEHQKMAQWIIDRIDADSKKEPVRYVEKKDPREHLFGINGIDPMSPYIPPSSVTRFENIADVINRKGFHASYPQSYTVVPNYYRRFNITPYFNPGADSDYAKGMLTIAGMIELNENRQPWQLARDQDVGLVIAIAEEYLKSMDSSRMDARCRDYCAKVERFLKVMRHGQDKIDVRTGTVNPNTLDFLAVLKKMLRRR